MSRKVSPARPPGVKGKMALLFLGTAGVLAGIAVLGLSGSEESSRRSGGTLGLVTAAKVSYVDRNLARAEDLLRQALKDRPGDKEAAVLLGRVLLDRGRLDEARSLFAEVLKGEPKNYEALRGMAAVSRNLGQADLGIVYLRRALELRKGDPEAWKALALAERETGNALGALSSLQESLSLDSKQADLSQALTELLTVKGDAAGSPVTVARGGGAAPLMPRPIDPQSLVPKPQVPDPARWLARPEGGKPR